MSAGHGVEIPPGTGVVQDNSSLRAMTTSNSARIHDASWSSQYYWCLWKVLLVFVEERFAAFSLAICVDADVV